MKKIYTKAGDKGITQLADGTKINKDSDHIDAIGCIDELNSFLGLTKAYAVEKIAGGSLVERVSRIQQELMSINSQLALASSLENITITCVEKLEQEIDAISKKLPPLNEFVIPGSNIISATLHIVRAVCRRTERVVVNYNKDLSVTLTYLNRLSDWLFVTARYMENIE